MPTICSPLLMVEGGVRTVDRRGTGSACRKADVQTQTDRYRQTDKRAQDPYTVTVSWGWQRARIEPREILCIARHKL